MFRSPSATQGHLFRRTLAVALLGRGWGRSPSRWCARSQSLALGDGGITTLGLTSSTSRSCPPSFCYPLLRALRRVLPTTLAAAARAGWRPPRRRASPRRSSSASSRLGAVVPIDLRALAASTIGA